MKKTAETNPSNGRPSVEQVQGRPSGTEGAEAPSAEVKQPFIAAKKKAARQDNWKAILMGGVLIAVIVVAALTHRSAISPPGSSASAGVSAGKSTQSSPNPLGSVIPLNQIGNGPEKPPDGTKVDSGTIANTAQQPPKAATAKNLNAVPPFGSEDNWRPPAFQGNSPVATGGQQAEKADHDALDKPSLVFVHSDTQTSTPQKSVANTGELEPALGLAPGTRLRAHLESAVSTAVKTPVVAVIEYNYEQDGEILIPAGAKAIGHLESADRSGYFGVRFDTLLMPDGTSVSIEAAATDLQLRPLRGSVQGKNTGKNILVRSLSGVGEVMATLLGRGSLNQPLSEADLLRGRVANNIGQASDEEVARLAITERLVVSLPASTEIYVVLEKQAKQPRVIAPSRPAPSNPNTAEQLHQLLELERELNQTTAAATASQ